MRFVRQVGAEWRQLARAKFGWVAIALAMAILAFLFYQYTVNEQAGVVEPMLRDPANMVSLFLLVYLALPGGIVAIVLGSYVGAKEFGFGTAGSLAVWAGRRGMMAAKVTVVGVACMASVVVVALFGWGLGSVHGVPWAATRPAVAIEQVALVAVAITVAGWMALAVGLACRSIAISNIVCFVAILGVEFLPYELAKTVGYVSPLACGFGMASRSFDNLHEISVIQMAAPIGSVAMSWVNVGVLGVIAITTIVLLTRWREVPE